MKLELTNGKTTIIIPDGDEAMARALAEALRPGWTVSGYMEFRVALAAPKKKRAPKKGAPAVPAAKPVDLDGKILGYLKLAPAPMPVGTIATMIGLQLDVEAVKAELGRLVKAGKVASEGKARGTRYRVAGGENGKPEAVA